MSYTLPSIYERTFAASNKTDAILVVDGKKLHINKSLLSYHSDHFKALFDSVKEESIPEIPIEDVNFEDFATLLSLVQHNPLKVTESNSEKLLQLGEQFQIPAAKRHVELFLITIEKDRMGKIRIADKYQLSDLLKNGVSLFKNKLDFKNLRSQPDYKNFNAKTKVAIFHKFLDMIEY